MVIEDLLERLTVSFAYFFFFFFWHKSNIYATNIQDGSLGLSTRIRGG